MKKIAFPKITFYLVILLFCFSNCKKNTDDEPSSLNVTTISVTEITSNSAKCKGVVSSTGNYTVGNCGSCWSESPSPTIDNYFTTDIQGQGSFTSTLKNLKSNTRYYVRAYATTSSGIMYGEELDFTTESNGGGPQSGLTISLEEIYDIHGYSAKCDIVATFDNSIEITELGACWSISDNPMIYNYHVSCETSSGSHTIEINNLEPSVTYHVRAYAIISTGMVSYSQEEKVFTTLSKPQVSTLDIININTTTATCKGSVINDGGAITIRGFCWSTSSDPEPTIHDNVITSGYGVGTFSAQLTNLTSNTTYFVRAFATNEVGTSYGNMVTFKTLINEWLYYGDGAFETRWGYKNGGTLYWAVAFPSTMLSEYDGCKITKVKMYSGLIASYTLQIAEDETVLSTLSYSLTSNGFHNLKVTPNVTIDSSKNLFIMLSCTHEAGGYPACSSKGTGNPNARWVWDGTEWVDAYTSGWSNNKDLTWIIQAYVSNGDKDDEIELIMPTTTVLTYPSINVFEKHGESTK